MDVNKIRFSNSNAYLIQNERSKSDIIEKINMKYKIDIFNMYDKSYSDKLLEIIKKKAPITCLISKGKQYILYFTKIYNENVSLLIDLKSKDKTIPKIIAVTLSVDKELFTDSIFLGELLNNNGNWVFLIESCKVYKGITTYNKSILNNIQYCYDFVNNYIDTPLAPFHITLKEFSDLNNLNNLLSNPTISPIGIKFLGLHNPITFLFNTRMYKDRYNNNNTFNLLKKYDYSHIKQNKKDLLKEFRSDYSQENNTFDFTHHNNIDVYKKFQFILKPSKTYGIFNLYINNDIIGIARISLIEINNDIIRLLNQQNYCYVEAFYNYKFGKWDIDKILNKPPIYNSVTNHVLIMNKLKKPFYLFESH